MILPTYLTPDENSSTTMILCNDGSKMYYYINWETGNSSIQNLDDLSSITAKNLYEKSFNIL